ncbi:MAG: hypothetical protein K2X48_13125 [Chitinophagaceae bacterium]|nr:hypothetical protein [Chitinophagaceae bacterium]
MLNPYPLQETDELSYQFVTDGGVTYHIYFLDYSYMFADYPMLANNVFSFNIDVVSGSVDTALSDERIGITVVEVFKTFFKERENVAVYVCDSSDERQLARKRKFDFWFWKYNDGSIIKEDGVAIVEDVEILNSLLVHRSNPLCMEIIFAFKDLNARAGDK